MLQKNSGRQREQATRFVKEAFDAAWERMLGELEKKQKEVNALLDAPSESPIREAVERLDQLKREIAQLQQDIALAEELRTPLNRAAQDHFAPPEDKGCFSG